MVKASKKSKKRQTALPEYHMSKVFYASPTDLSARVPELHPLSEKVIAVFGLGCLGAPSVLEFARAGVGFIRLVDHDIVDPATTVRWPIGFTAAGYKKAYILSEFIRQNYPYVQCDANDFKVGRTRYDNLEKLQPLDQEKIEDIVAGADLIYDSTAEVGVQYFLTSYALEHQIPYIGVSGKLGGWGGKVFRIRSFKGTGCWFCYEYACREGIIPEPPFDKNGKFKPVGCADPTFTGAGFDMVQIALMGVKMAISTLCEGEVDAYPSFDGDAVHIRMRNEDGSLIAPVFETYKIERRVECEVCNGKA